jgi:hypothetical protein
MEYWGIKEINARMGWKHPTTPVEQLKQNGFLMFKRRRGKYPRLYWYTNDSLIAAYEIARCKADRDRLLEAEAKKIR